MRYIVPFVSAWLLAAVFDVSISSQASRATPPGAEACAALASGKVAGLATLSATYDSGSNTQPAHCVVRGSAAPRTGADGKPYETRFELRLPTAWSGRFLYQGAGGNDGVVAPAVGRNTRSFPDTGLQPCPDCAATAASATEQTSDENETCGVGWMLAMVGHGASLNLPRAPPHSRKCVVAGWTGRRSVYDRGPQIDRLSINEVRKVSRRTNRQSAVD
jgi:hypothetical protein